MDERKHIRQALLDFTEKYPAIVCVYLFGSVTGPLFSNKSDVDIGLAGQHPLTATQKKQFKTELEQILQRDVDLVDLHQATGAILRRALRGTCILSRDSTVRYQLMQRLIYDTEDMQPLRDRTMHLRRLRFAHGY